MQTIIVHHEQAKFWKPSVSMSQKHDRRQMTAAMMSNWSSAFLRFCYENAAYSQNICGTCVGCLPTANIYAKTKTKENKRKQKEAKNQPSTTAFEGHSGMSGKATQKPYQMREQLLSCMHSKFKPISGIQKRLHNLGTLASVAVVETAFHAIQARCGQSFNTSAKCYRLPTANCKTTTKKTKTTHILGFQEVNT